MSYVFEIIDKSGREIHLSQERWSHIAGKHPEYPNLLEDIKRALTKPQMIVPEAFDNKKMNYYIQLKNIGRYLLVGVKYLNGKGFVTTAFVVRHIRRK